MDVRKTADEKIRKIHIDGDGWRKEALRYGFGSRDRYGLKQHRKCELLRASSREGFSSRVIPRVLFQICCTARFVGRVEGRLQEGAMKHEGEERWAVCGVRCAAGSSRGAGARED